MNWITTSVAGKLIAGRLGRVPIYAHTDRHLAVILGVAPPDLNKLINGY